jgi:hypothetical protein
VSAQALAFAPLPRQAGRTALRYRQDACATGSDRHRRGRLRHSLSGQRQDAWATTGEGAVEVLWGAGRAEGVELERGDVGGDGESAQGRPSRRWRCAGRQGDGPSVRQQWAGGQLERKP